MTKDDMQKRLKEQHRMCRERIAMGRYADREQKAYYSGMCDALRIALSEIGELSMESKGIYKITASADGRSQIKMELTESQYDFLRDVFNKMNDKRESYGPVLSIDKIGE